MSLLPILLAATQAGSDPQSPLTLDVRAPRASFGVLEDVTLEVEVRNRSAEMIAGLVVSYDTWQEHLLLVSFRQACLTRADDVDSLGGSLEANRRPRRCRHNPHSHDERISTWRGVSSSAGDGVDGVERGSRMRCGGRLWIWPAAMA